MYGFCIDKKRLYDRLLLYGICTGREVIEQSKRRGFYEAIKLMISEEQEEMFLKQFYQIATKAIEKAQENAGMTREYLNQKEMAEYLNVSENFLKNAVRNEGLPVVELGARKFYSKKAVNEFMFARMKRGVNIER